MTFELSLKEQIEFSEVHQEAMIKLWGVDNTSKFDPSC